MTDRQEKGMNALSGAESIEEYYQLNHDPFAARTPGFKFFTPQRKTVLAELHHLARFGDQVLLVTGPHGSGKTLLRQALVASSNKDTTQCVVTTAREFPGASALTSFFCQAVNASGRDSQSLLFRAGQVHETGVNLYLIIDDAHLLEQEALQELVDWSRVSDGESPLRIFLFADDSIEPMIDSVNADEEGAEWLHRIALQPYSLDETRDYMAQRLDAAGQGIELLDEDQIQWIHRHSGGWPGRINDAAGQSMAEAMAEQGSPVTSRRAVLPLKSLVAVILVAVGIGFAWFMGERQEESVTTVLELPEPVVAVDAINDPQLVELTELNAQPEVDASGVSTEPNVRSEAEANSADAGSAMGSAERSATVSLFPSAESRQDSEASGAQAAVAAPARPEPVASTPVEEAPKPSAVVTPSAAPAAPAPQPAQQAGVPSAPSASQATAQATGSDNWYRSQQPARYVLQVLGSRSRAAAIDFIAKNSGVAELRFFQTTYQGEPWFVVTQGSYSGRQQAQQGVSTLPASMRSANPWPRSVGDIQKALE